MNSDIQNTSFGSEFNAKEAVAERAISLGEATEEEQLYSDINYENYDLSSDSYKYDLIDKFRFTPDSLVVVGDSIVYFGGELTTGEVILGGKPITGRVFSDAIKQDVDLGVKSIQEGKRVIAFAIDAEKAKEYVKRFKKEMAA